MGVRVRGVAVASAAIGSLLLAGSASATRIVTWTLRSRYVNPNGPTPFNHPAGTNPHRRNALRVNIYLPDGYNGRRRFPILWLLHGHGDDYESWVNPRYGDLLRLAPHFPGIIVMPEAAQGWYTDWLSGGRRRPGWESYFLLELMPLVERRLRILPGRSHHAIAGLSMGGEGAAFLAEQRPGYFGALATFSGVLSIQRPEWPTGFNTQGQNYTTLYGPRTGFYATAHNPVALAGNLSYTRVLIRNGNGEPAPSEVNNYFGIAAESELSFHARDFAAATRKAGAPTTLTFHQGIHAWDYWRKDFLAALNWGFFRAVPEHPRRWTFTTADQHDLVWDLRLDFKRPPAAVERFTRSGARLRGSGAGKLVITTAGGCRLTERMPFAVKLPAGSCS